MDLTALRGVIFDLDGTLYVQPWYMKPLAALLLVRDIGILRHMTAARDSLRGREFEGRETLLAAFHEELGRRAGLGPMGAARWYEQRFTPAFLSILRSSCSVRPGLVEVLSGLRSRGIRTAVLSDYGVVAERLAALRIPASLFDDLASAEDSGALKPSPRPFLDTARRLGLDPDRVLVVGDRDDLDGLGARSAGMSFLPAGDTHRLLFSNDSKEL